MRQVLEDEFSTPPEIDLDSLSDLHNVRSRTAILIKHDSKVVVLIHQTTAILDFTWLASLPDSVNTTLLVVYPNVILLCTSHQYLGDFLQLGLS